MSVKSYLDEMEEIKQEIKNNNAKNKALRERIRELENNVQNYLNSKNQPGLKYKDKAIMLETGEKRLKKKKKDKEMDSIAYLESLGVPDPKIAYQKVLDLQKGTPVQHQALKIQKLGK